MTLAQFYGPRDALRFRQFVMREYRRPSVDLRDLSGNPETDFLELALLSVREHLRQSFSNARADGRAFSVYPAYVDCMSADAFAAQTDQTHLCGVTIGLAVSFFEFSLFSFSQASMFPDVADPSDESSPSPIDGYPPGFWMRGPGAALQQEAFLNHAQALVPRNPDRYLLATLLSILMIRFVWFHELFHCLNGHVGLVGSRGWALSLHENQFLEQNKLSAAELQRLEFDADQSAFHVACQVQMAEQENIEALQRLPLETRLRLVIFAAHATTWIIEEHNRRQEHPASADHPEPYARLHNLLRTLASNLAPQIQNVSALHLRVLADMDALALVLPSFPSGARILADMGQWEWQNGLDQEQFALEALRAELQPFRFTEQSRKEASVGHKARPT